MRLRFAVLALMLAAASPAIAQPSQASQSDGEMVGAARWVEDYSQALTTSTATFAEFNQHFQSLAAGPLTPDRAAAAVVQLRATLGRVRSSVHRSNAMLDALPNLSAAASSEMQAPQLLADGRAHNKRLLALLDGYDTFIVAFGKGDKAGIERLYPRVLEGTAAMLTQQRLVFRTRQAAVPRSESSHQALGVAGQLYRTMEAMFRHSNTARLGSEAQAAAAALALRGELRGIGEDTRAIAAEGRRNLDAEIAAAEAEAKTARAGDEARMAQRVRLVLAAERETFAVADRLIAFAEENSAIRAAQLRPVGPASAMAPLRQLEQDYMAVGEAQVALLTEGQ